MSVVPDLYDAWGPIARAQGISCFPGGTLTDNGAGQVVIGSPGLYIFSPLGQDHVIVAPGTYTVTNWGSLAVKIPPTTAGEGASVVPEVIPWTDNTSKFPHRDYIVLGQRVSIGRIAWRYPALERAANPVVTNPWSDSGWQRLGIEIAYLDGHTNYGVPHGAAGEVAIRRLPSGLVIGKGLISGGARTGQRIFQIPVGFRPTSTPLIPILHTANNQSGAESFRLAVPGNGSYAADHDWCLLNSAGWVWGSLAGITWLAEQ
jgi:hypothetical protein